MGTTAPQAYLAYSYDRNIVVNDTIAMKYFVYLILALYSYKVIGQFILIATYRSKSYKVKMARHIYTMPARAFAVFVLGSMMGIWWLLHIEDLYWMIVKRANKFTLGTL